MCYRGCPAVLPGVRFWGTHSLWAPSLPQELGPDWWEQMPPRSPHLEESPGRYDLSSVSVASHGCSFPSRSIGCVPASCRPFCRVLVTDVSLTLLTPYTWAVEGRTWGLDQAVSSPSQGPSQVAESDLKLSLAVPSCFPSSYYPLAPPHGGQTTPTWSRRALKSQHVSLHLPPQHLLDTSSGLCCFLNIPPASCEIPLLGSPMSSGLCTV